MQTSAFGFAMIGIFISCVSIYFSCKIQKKAWRWLAYLGSLLAGITSVIIIAVIVEPPLSTISRAGQYWLYLLLAGLALYALVKGLTSTLFKTQPPGQ